MRNMTNQISAGVSVLEQWLADEDARRAVMNNGVGPGVVIAGKNGLEAMQATLQGLAPYPSIGYTTAELSVNLVKAIGKTSRVRAIGTVLHCGRQLATAEAKLVGPDGTLYAHATTTCLVFEIPSQL